MKNILTISKREVTRLRTRFSGRSRLVVIAIIALTIIASYVIYHQDLVISKGLYNVGVSADSPYLADERFNVVQVERGAVYDLLEKKTIDIYVDGNKVISSDDERSKYAAGALQQYLKKQELLRISDAYDIDRAFPLRVEIRYLDVPEGSKNSETGALEPDIIEFTEPTEVQPEVSESGPGIEPEVDNTPEPSQLSEPTPSETTEPVSTPDASLPEPPLPSSTYTSDTAVRQQLADFSGSNRLPEFKAEFVSESDIIIPSLMTPPIPLSQVLVTFLYVVPVFFVSLFFTSSFTEEKVNRKLTLLLSAPVTRLQVILGKMLPYLLYSLAVIIAITLALRGNVLLGIAIFLPVMLFIFSIYLMVALTYRTFKDQTFFSVLALSVITVYLVGPAMFAGVNDLSYISPLTLAVDMYRGETFGIKEYFLATTPLFLIFLQTMFIATRVFNEEYLMGFRPLHTKVAEAVYLAMDKSHLNASVLLLSLFLVPVVFVVQLVSIVFVTNLPMPFSLWFVILVSVVIEEIAKSMGIIVLLQNSIVKTRKSLVKLSFLSALGFLLGEKILLFLALSVLSESMFISAVFGAGLLVVPLILHMVSTSSVCLLTANRGIKYYPLAIVAGTVIHTLYNLYVIGNIL